MVCTGLGRRGAGLFRSASPPARHGSLDHTLSAPGQSAATRSGRADPCLDLHRRSFRAEGRWRLPRGGPRAGRAVGARLSGAVRAAFATATGGRPATRSSSRSRSTIPSISTPWPNSAGPASARLSCTCTTITTRPRTSARPCWQAQELFAHRHGLLACDRRTGRPAYGFIHGNWALDNSRPDGRWCGVNNELDVLRETGCYADFTFPSAPSPTQPRKINSIYYAVDDPQPTPFARPGDRRRHPTGSA